MCGIGCILRFTPGDEPPPISHGWIAALDDGLHHRGRDGQGVFLDRTRAAGGWIDVAMVHRRLSILDHAGGGQPMVDPPPRAPVLMPQTSDPGTLAVVFNGCIYNHRALRRELESLGAVFRSDHSDTEVLVHAYRAWGREMPRRLEGMFALAIWDRHAAELFVARDRAGEKPLEVFSGALGRQIVHIVSSTHAGVIRAANAMSMRVGHDVEGVMHFASLAPPGADHATGPMLRPRRCLPGRWLRLVPEDAAVQEKLNANFGVFWTPPPRGSTAPNPAQLDALIGAAVSERLEADAPLACLLSGGVDSSIIAAHARRLAPGLKTFCVRMPDVAYDESPFAAAVAAHLGTQHVTLDCHPRPLEDLERLIGEMGVPFADSSLLPTYWLCRAVGEHAKVALSGDGGDELFGGYERYVVAMWPWWVRTAAGLLPASLLDSANPKSRRSKLARLSRACGGAGYADIIDAFDSQMRGGPRNTTRDVIAWPPDPLREDFGESLRTDILRKVDSASMSAGVEVRAPLLATAVLETAFSSPLDALMPRCGLGHRRLKGLLKDALALHVPPSLFERPKSGFAIPLGRWIREDFGGLGTAIGDAIHTSEPWRMSGWEWLDARLRQRLWDEHRRGTRDHAQRLFQILTLHLWDRWLRRVSA